MATSLLMFRQRFFHSCRYGSLLILLGSFSGGREFLL
jgi:hypothetical protein